MTKMMTIDKFLSLFKNDFALMFAESSASICMWETKKSDREAVEDINHNPPFGMGIHNDKVYDLSQYKFCEEPKVYHHALQTVVSYDKKNDVVRIRYYSDGVEERRCSFSEILRVAQEAKEKNIPAKKLLENLYYRIESPDKTETQQMMERIAGMEDKQYFNNIWGE